MFAVVVWFFWLSWLTCLIIAYLINLRHHFLLHWVICFGGYLFANTFFWKKNQFFFIFLGFSICSSFGRQLSQNCGWAGRNLMCDRTLPSLLVLFNCCPSLISTKKRAYVTQPVIKYLQKTKQARKLQKSLQKNIAKIKANNSSGIMAAIRFIKIIIIFYKKRSINQHLTEICHIIKNNNKKQTAINLHWNENYIDWL